MLVPSGTRSSGGGRRRELCLVSRVRRRARGRKAVAPEVEQQPEAVITAVAAVERPGLGRTHFTCRLVHLDALLQQQVGLTTVLFSCCVLRLLQRHLCKDGSYKK